ncbi:hypothetical protein MFLAVUS_011401 [Mucor flavus]|uniref:Uncharacterized protein n=1 Tax=Mucor flavus TaxID=439312 RepID=A0ABP9ZFH1_9FUNG
MSLLQKYQSKTYVEDVAPQVPDVKAIVVYYSFHQVLRETLWLKQSEEGNRVNRQLNV